MIFYFDPSKLPRSMTRAQWKEAYRWLREVSRKVDAALAERTKKLLFGR